ncbi:histidine phosphatase family protein [Ilumatobacter sp.]|uniref:histidine phosphatase family protein n=1 Tax=Ilumatobacter sp. TaxID=1967498 RepID=UPI003AF5BBAB
MEIVLIRHGQPEWTKDGLNVVDPPLTELGHRQAELMADALAAEEFDEVLVSPLQRARQTAAPLYRRLGRPESVEPWLEEIRDPSWHGTPREKAEHAYDELKSRPAAQRWHGLVGGESIREFTERIHAGATEFLRHRRIERIEHDLPIWSAGDFGRRIALVAHAGTNSVTIGHLLGLDPTPWEWDRFVIGHASISRIEALPLRDGWTFSLTSLSGSEHIPAGQRSR